MHTRAFCTLLSCLVLALACGAADEPAARAPEVPVARPLVREVTDHEDFTGRTEAAANVQLRARVSGYLSRVTFQDGAEVKEGDVLFEIDPRPYQAEMDRATAALAVAEARLKRAEVEQKQAETLFDRKIISHGDLERATAERVGAEASVRQAQAVRELAKLNLDFTRVRAPIAGHIGRRLLDPGNLAKADDTILATIVSRDPMHVYFDIDERSALHLRRLMRQGGPGPDKVPVAVGLANEEGHLHHGAVNFADNRVDPDTGTLRMRATLANKDRLLMPGLFVRVRLAIGRPYRALLVPAQVIMTEAAEKFVFVVNDKQVIERRTVALGSVHDGLRVVASGLKPDDRVVVGRLEGLRPGTAVRPQEAQMPPPGKSGAGEPRSEAPAGPSAPITDPRPAAEPGPVVLVEAAYPGADAAVVADTVAAPIEQQVRGVEKMLSMRSRCTTDGRYTLAVTFAAGTDPAIAQVLVQNRVSLAAPVLPRVVERAGVAVKKAAPGVLRIVTLSSPDGRRDELYLGNYARLQIEDDLARQPGVGAVTVVGGRDYGLHVWLDPLKLAARKLTIEDAVRAIEEQFRTVPSPVAQPPAAKVRGTGSPLTVTPLGRPIDPEDLQGLILKVDGEGRIVYLRDVARVEIGGGPRRGHASLNGRPAVALVLRPAESPPKKPSAALRGALNDIRKRLPEGVRLDAFDVTTPADYLLLDPALPAGTSAERTARLLGRCAALVGEVQGIEDVLALSEDPFDLFGGAPCIVVRLAAAVKGEAGRDRVTKAVRARLDELKEITVRLRDLSGRSARWGYPLDLAVRGPEVDRVREFAAKFADRMGQSKELTDVRADPASTPRPQAVVEVDRKEAAARGVSMDDVWTTLQVYLGAGHVNDFNRFGRTWQVRVEIAPGSGDLAKDVGKLQVRNARGQMIPLAVFVRVREVEAPQALDFLDGRPMVEVTANPAAGVPPARARALCETLAEEVRKELRLPAGYRLRWLPGGTERERR